MRDLVLAIDQGTTGTTAMVVDRDVRVLAKRNVTFTNHYPKPGHVEHDVKEIKIQRRREAREKDLYRKLKDELEPLEEVSEGYAKEKVQREIADRPGARGRLQFFSAALPAMASA